MNRILLFVLLVCSATVYAQLNATTSTLKQEKIVMITGVRFAYPLIQKWIDDYNKSNPDVQLIIESRGTGDPSRYDILVEAYVPEADKKLSRDFFYVGRYAVLPVANSRSTFSKVYASKGLHRDLIKQLFFRDIFASKSDQSVIKEPYTVYTRLQKAGAPLTFAQYFGYQQKDIYGKAIAGADEHMLKAVLRDSIGLSYLPLNLLFDVKTGNPLEGITILPVDLNGNGKVSAEEKFYQELPVALEYLETKNQKEINNVPIEHLNLSIEKNSTNADAIAFLKWIIEHGEQDLHAFGYLKPIAPSSDKPRQNP
jgi:phosphate transport system substrate-binding protein